MIISTKAITIRYTQGGIYQYATIKYDADDKIIKKDFNPSWVDLNKVPSLDSLDNIDDILKVINEFSGNSATIHLINGEPIEYYNDIKVKEFNKNFKKELELFIEKQALILFKEHIYPILKEKKYIISRSDFMHFIIIERNEENIWDNVWDNIHIEMICYCFIKNFTEVSVNFSSEVSNIRINAFSKFMNLIYLSDIKDLNIYFDPKNLPR